MTLWRRLVRAWRQWRRPKRRAQVIPLPDPKRRGFRPHGKTVR